MLTYVILGLGAIALWHFIYDGIILPSIRWALRNRLFELRDRIRMLAIKDEVQNCEEAYCFVHDSVNVFLTRLHLLTISQAVEISRAIARDAKLRSRIQKRIDMIERCQNQEITDAFQKMDCVLRIALIANSGTWFLYVIPAFVVFLLMSYLTVLIRSLVSLSPSDASRLMPATATA